MPDFGVNDLFAILGTRFAMGKDEEMREGSKIAHDIYKVYVNDDYVGDKVLVAQNEKIEDLERYLRNTGFGDFSTNLVGNEYSINSSGENALELKNTLQIYLNSD